VVSFMLCAQIHHIEGVIKDNTDESLLSGVSILVKGTTRQASSDEKGRFQITLPDSNATLVFSFSGYKSHEIMLSTESNFLVMSLEEDTQTITLTEGLTDYGTNPKNLPKAITPIPSVKVAQAPISLLLINYLRKN
jgi:TonB-dependent starch-binding outer membrane protein SusC